MFLRKIKVNGEKLSEKSALLLIVDTELYVKLYRKLTYAIKENILGSMQNIKFVISINNSNKTNVWSLDWSQNRMNSKHFEADITSGNSSHFKRN